MLVAVAGAFGFSDGSYVGCRTTQLGDAQQQQRDDGILLYDEQ
jgi:hypothetical protein